MVDNDTEMGTLEKKEISRLIQALVTHDAIRLAIEPVPPQDLAA